MKFVYWSRGKFSLLFIIAGALSIYLGLEIANALDMLQTRSGSFSFAWLSFFFGLASVVSLVFLAVGSLVWLYARERRIASLLFAFSAVMMIIFTSFANLKESMFFSSLGKIGALFAVNIIISILIYFPQELLLISNNRFGKWKIVFGGYLLFSSTFTVICSLIILNVFGLYSLKSLVWLYYVLGCCSIVGITVYSYKRLESVRKKQQVRIFVYGVILSLLPSFSLTLVPAILNFTAVDGGYTSLAFVIFPLALGYSVLRYQLLILDTYIRRIVSFIVGIVALAILVYAEITCIHIFSHGNISIVTVSFVVISLAIFAPLIWWQARKFANGLLFPDVIRYNRVLQEPSLVSEEILHVDDVLPLIATAAMEAFEVPLVCLCVLDETSTSYQLSPIFSDRESDFPRIALFSNLQRMLGALPHKDEYCLDVRLPALQRLLHARRPMLLSEIILSKEDYFCNFDRVMNATSPLGQDDYLLAPLRSHGQMIGLLVLGERADHQPYAGPDFEAAQILTGRFSPLLENARLYERLTKSYARQKEVDALKEQFIMVASHELRTPLTIVQGYVELLYEHQDQIIPEMQTEFLKKVRVGCDELNLMVNQIVDANLVHVDVSKINLHPIPLNLTVQRVLEMLSAVIQSEERSICTSIASDLTVFADDLRLRQILLNLLSNALKYSAPGTPIEISAVQENMEVEISIRDYGLGVPSEKQQEIFAPFTRLDRDLNSPVRGSGLGLYICEQFVNAMGGRISVESSGVPNKGSVFKFVLRCTPLDQAPSAQSVPVPALP